VREYFLDNNRTVLHILNSQTSFDKQPLNMDRTLRCLVSTRPKLCFRLTSVWN